MCNAIKTTKKKIFERNQVEKNGNLSRNYLVRPLAPEFIKKLNHPGDFFYFRPHLSKMKLFNITCSIKSINKITVKNK